MKVCKNCGEINPNDCDYCCSCGKSKFIFQEEEVCRYCGAINDTSFVYCINCGNELHSVEPPASEPVAPTPDAPTGEGSYTPIPVDMREQLSEIYGGGVPSSTPTETASCPSCGTLVPIHAIYCQKCGKMVAGLHEHRVVKRKICPHCGRPNSLESGLCSYCFSPLTNAETQDLQVVHDHKQVGVEMIQQAFLQDEHGKKKICSNCGSLNPLEELFCVSCGLKLDTEEQKKFCPNCGTENASSDAFCVKCQWSFNGTAPGCEDKWKCSVCGNLNDNKDDFCVVCGAQKQMEIPPKSGKKSGRKK